MRGKKGVGRICDSSKLKNLTIVLGLLTLCILTLIAVYGTDIRRDDLIWEDDFGILDDGKWRHVVSGDRGQDGEFQYYRRDRRNSYAEDGILHLKVTPVSDELSDAEIRRGYQNLPGCNVEPCLVTADPNGDCILPVFSAQLHTKDLFTVERGRVEVRAKFPSGDWLRAGIALLPNDNAYGGRPVSGEIIIAEGCGNKFLTAEDGHSLGADTVRQSLHWSPEMPFNQSYYNMNKKTYWETKLLEGYFSDDFHTFGIEWTGGHIAFFVDEEERGRVTPPGGGFWELGGFSIDLNRLNPWAKGSIMAPFDRPFYLVLRLSVGGTFFEDSFSNADYPKPWNRSSRHPITDFYEKAKFYVPTWDKPELLIDYVRVFQD